MLSSLGVWWNIGDYGRVTRKELTQKGDAHKRRSSHHERSSRRNTTKRSRAERNDPSAASAAWLTASWPGGYFNGSAAVSTDWLRSDPVVWNCHIVSNRHVVLNRRFRTDTRPRRRSAAVLLQRTAALVIIVQFRAQSRELRRLWLCPPTTARGRQVDCSLV